eukprot:2670706-Amphidinium_carterae.1
MAADSFTSTAHALLAKYVGANAPISTSGFSCGVEVTEGDADHILSVEHVAVYISTSFHEKRGDVRIMLTSPSGTESLLAPARNHDARGTNSTYGDYDSWKFVTVKNWGESPIGNWSLSVADVRQNDADGYLHSWTLAIYGVCKGGANECTKIFYPY